MKSPRIAGCVLTLLLCVGLSSANAAPYTFYFDEGGSGLIDLRNGNGFQTLAGSLLPDPTWAGHQSLTFLLPTAGNPDVVTRDIRVLEINQEVSDGLRFTNASGDLSGQVADRLIYYSVDTNAGLLADTGLPPNFRTNTAIFEDRLGNFTYQPGGPASYVFVGATVPEPPALFMAGISGGLGLLWSLCRHRRAARSRGSEG